MNTPIIYVKILHAPIIVYILQYFPFYFLTTCDFLAHNRIKKIVVQVVVVVILYIKYV